MNVARGEGWETGREKKCIQLICFWEFCSLFIDTVRQLKECCKDQLDRETQGSVSTWECKRQSETIFQISKC